jgi:hypothetical protein
MTQAEAYAHLVQALAELRWQWRMRKVLEGALLALAGTAGVLLAGVTADNVLHLEPAGRAAVAALLWATLVLALAALVLRRWLEDRRDDFFAALVERRYPELHNRLINALQLGRGRANGFSPRLIEAIISDAAEATAELDLTTSLDRRPMRRAVGLALAAGLAIAVYALLLTPRFVNGLARVLLPSADLPAHTATRILEWSVKPGNSRGPEGAPVQVEVKVAGDMPATAQLVRRSSDRTQSAAMQPDPAAGDTFRFSVLQPAESFDYYITAGDGRSATYHVEIVKRPLVEDLEPTYRLPAYVAVPPRRVEASNGEIAAIAGTTVSLALKASKPLQEAALALDGGERIAFEKGGDDRTWLVSFVIWSRAAKAVQPGNCRPVVAPTRYQIRLLDTEGYENLDPLWHPISLVPDRPPSVAVTLPGRDLQARPSERIDLAVDARDDYGLGEVRLWYRVNEEPAARELVRFPHAGPPELEARDRFRWDLGSGGLKTGDVVRYWATATDRNTVTGPGQSESTRFSLFLVTPEQVATRLDVEVQEYA